VALHYTPDGKVERLQRVTDPAWLWSAEIEATNLLARATPLNEFLALQTSG
jgi:hypothetical protein